jgi:CO/xanthine dehydrogenase Mo-binding subunit
MSTAAVEAVLAASISSRPASGRAFRAGRGLERWRDRNAVPLYDFPNQKIVRHLIREMPLRTSALRTLGAYGNVFALESFMDDEAGAMRADPIEFRLRYMKDARARAVIEAAAAKAGWKPGYRNDGVHGRGFGFQVQKPLLLRSLHVMSVDRKRGGLK